MRDDDGCIHQGETLPATDFDGFVGASPVMQAVYARIRRAAASDAPVFISGETGTGKELAAESLHRHGRRASGPLVTVNCAALPVDLIESEIFGHRRGAFTGAAFDYAGALARAEGGTLFLDEITEMPARLQAKLLRVVETRSYAPLGDARMSQADLRIVAASNRDLPDALKGGHLRPDLYHRLGALTLHLPPLRARDAADILHVARYLLAVIWREEGRPGPPPALDAARIAGKSWPGNIRQLQNALRQLVVFGDDSGLQPDADNEVTPLSLAEMERRHIDAMVAQCGGNLAAAARVLGVDVSTLHRKRKRGATAP